MPERSQANPTRFFAWVLALSVPFYIWGVLWPIHGLPLGLPVTAAMVVVPATVATLLARREAGACAAWNLWRRVGDVERVPSVRWLAMSLGCMPVVDALAYAAMRALSLPLPSTISRPLLASPVIFVVFFVGAVFEEIGWTAYATETLQRRHGVVGAGLIIGAVWAIWHIVLWLGQGHTAWWVLAQTLAVLTMRIIMGWIYARGGRSLFLAIVFHAMINTSSMVSYGSYYNPLVVAAILGIVAGAIGILSESPRASRSNLLGP